MIPSLSRHTRAAQQILRLLERQRQALLAGRIEMSADLSPRIDAALETLESGAPSDKGELRHLLEQVRIRAERNAKLTAAARRGIAEARRAFGELDQARGQLGTYSDTGVRRDIAGSRSTRDRRT